MKADSEHFILIIIMSSHIKGYMSMQPKQEKQCCCPRCAVGVQYNVLNYLIYMDHNAVADAKPLQKSL